MLRQNRNQHRHGKYFHALRQLHRRIRDFLSSNVLQLLQEIKDASPPALLAVVQSPELSCQSSRLVFSLQYVQETTGLLILAARLIAGLVILERFLPLCVTSFACLGRLYILLLQCQLHHISVYNRLTATAARGKVPLPPTLPPRLYHIWQASTLLISSRAFPTPGPITTSSNNSSNNSSSSSKKKKKVKSGALEMTADALFSTYANMAPAPATLAPVAASPAAPVTGTPAAKTPVETQEAEGRHKRLKGQIGDGQGREGQGREEQGRAGQGIVGQGEDGKGRDGGERGRGPFGADGPSMAVLMQELGFGEFISAPGLGGDDGDGGREEGMGRGEDGRREGGEDGEMDSEGGREEILEDEGGEGEMEEGEGEMEKGEGEMEVDGEEWGADREEGEGEKVEEGEEGEEVEREEGEEEEERDEDLKERKAGEESGSLRIGTREKKERKLAGIGAAARMMGVEDQAVKRSSVGVSGARPQVAAVGKLRGEKNVSGNAGGKKSNLGKVAKQSAALGAGLDARGAALDQKGRDAQGRLYRKEKKRVDKKASILKDLLPP
ncbi:unnamed protein product [Closterium sp. NIES-53]